MTWRARWFDGHNSLAHDALISFDQGELRIQLVDPSGGTLGPLLVPAERIEASERFAGAPRKVQLPDGSSLQVEDDLSLGFDRLLRTLGHRPGLPATLMRRWTTALTCLVLLIGLIAWIDRQGAGLLASRAVVLVPHSVDQAIGDTVWDFLSRNWLAPSQVSAARQDDLYGQAEELIEAQDLDLAWELEFQNMRNSKDAFNALTLPDGTIVLLDGLTGSLTDPQVLAIIGHELGHVVHRHSMQRLLRRVGLLAIAGVVWGDVSSLGAAATAGFQDLHYSRDDEREADAFAIEFLRNGGLPESALAEAFEAMSAQESSGNLPGFLSTHPPTEERIRAAREAVAD